MFYHFNQNNSGGAFVFNEHRGITRHVIIEAASREEANDALEQLGEAFDEGCPCCGDRWSRQASWDEGTSTPKVYDEDPDNQELYRKFARMAPGKETCVHYLDGRKEWFGKQA